MTSTLRKLNFDAVKTNIQDRLKANGREQVLRELAQLQLAVYVMCDGGLLGRFAAQQPGDFYIDSRVGRLPYSQTKIMQVIAVMNIYCEVLGLNPRNVHDVELRPFFDAHASGVW